MGRAGRAIILAVAMLLSVQGHAQIQEEIIIMGGPNSRTGGTGGTNCGVGALDLSTGCAQPMLFGGLF